MSLSKLYESIKEQKQLQNKIEQSRSKKPSLYLKLHNKKIASLSTSD